MNDRAAAPLLDADAIESTSDSIAELLDLSKQQRNLLLLRPLFQLELNKRAVGKDVASENALFEGIDTHYLVLSALDFMMEGTSINMGCTHAEVLDQLAAVAQAIRANLIAYVSEFSEDARDVFERFKFTERIAELDDKDLLFQVTQSFANVDLHPTAVPNDLMGLVFEELIRKFSELSNETAGEHFTPREVVRLIVHCLFAGDDEALSKPGVVRSMYDPTAGTGGILSVGEATAKGINSSAIIRLFGQELNDESYAICKADMLIKGQDPANIKRGNTLSADGHAGTKFDYGAANPPFGVDWKKVKDFIEDEHKRRGYAGRFGPGLPRVSDGSLLFLMHLIDKMRPAEEGGGRIGIVLNGSPLFTGDAGSGESEIRRWILEQDLLEAIIALPNDLFFNTGIASQSKILKDALVKELGELLRELTSAQITASKDAQLQLVDRLTQTSKEQVDASREDNKALGATIAESIQQSLQGPLQDIASTVKSASGDQSATAARMLQDVMASFSQRLNDLFGGQISGLSDLNQQTAKSIQDAVGTLQTLVANIEESSRRSTDTMAERMAQAIETMEARQEAMNAQSAAFIEQIRQLVASSQSETNTKLQATLETIGTQVSGMLATLNDSQAAVFESNRAREQVMADRTTSAVNSMSESVEAAIKEIGVASAQMAQNVAVLTQTTSTSVDKMNAGAEQLGAARIFARQEQSHQGQASQS